MSFHPSQKFLAVLALLEVASFWGLCWIGYRQLHSYGMSGMGAAVATSVVSLILAFVWARRSLADGLWRKYSPLMICGLMLASAVSSLGFTWGMVHGEVMRVMLLFYLMPMWSVIAARVFLNEHPNWAGWLGVGMGLCGAALMLYDPVLGAPWPTSPAEWAGLAAGMGSTTLNILIKKTPDMRRDSRAFFLALGGVILGLAWLPFETGPHLPHSDSIWVAVAIAVLIGALWLLTNSAYQFGMSHLTTHQAVVIFPFELVVGALSSAWLAGEVLTINGWIGGASIVSAGAVSAWFSADKT